MHAAANRDGGASLAIVHAVSIIGVACRKNTAPTAPVPCRSTTADAGGDPPAVQRALDPWFLPVLATASLTFGLGILGFVRATS